MYRLSEILILDLILLVLSSFFGIEGLIKVFVIELFYTLLWIGGRV